MVLLRAAGGTLPVGDLKPAGGIAQISGMPLSQMILMCCAKARAGLLRMSCALPFNAVKGTPLRAVADNYLAIVGGMGLLGGTGSALVLRPGLAVTSAHVVASHESFTALSTIGSVRVTVLAVSQRLDLAVLSVPSHVGRLLPVRDAEVGDTVWAMGTTTGGNAPTARGTVETTSARVCLEADCDGNGPFQEGLMFAAPAGPGYSGGPVVDSCGNVVGLTEGIYTRMFGDWPARWPFQPRMFAYRMGDVLREAERLYGAVAV